MSVVYSLDVFISNVFKDKSLVTKISSATASWEAKLTAGDHPEVLSKPDLEPARAIILVKIVTLGVKMWASKEVLRQAPQHLSVYLLPRLSAHVAVIVPSCAISHGSERTSVALSQEDSAIPDASVFPCTRYAKLPFSRRESA